MTVPALHASAKFRDITIDVSDSCNCCCFRWKRSPIRPTTPMYINSDGVAIKFNAKSFDSEIESLKRAISHLNDLISQNAELTNRNIKEVREELEKYIGISLDEDDPPQLTYAMISRINDAIKDIFN